jgi:hypothetical protein
MIYSSNPKFTATPENLGILGIAGDQIDNAVIIQVTAVHGTSESGTGVAVPVIKFEDDTTTITITGLYGDSTFYVDYNIRIVPAYVTVYGNQRTGVIDSVVGTECQFSYWDGEAIVDTYSYVGDLEGIYTTCTFDVYSPGAIPASSYKSRNELIPIVPVQ